MSALSRRWRELTSRGLSPVVAITEALEDRLADAARVARFARGLLAFEPRPDDIFISTYPRSGTTWLQLIVHLLVRGGGLDFEHISQVAPWFERQLALGRVSAADFARLPAPRVFKSHLPHGWLPRPGRYIYAERDGRDVAVSYYHFYRSHLGFEGSFDAFYDRFVRGELQYRSWFKHVQGWRRQAEDPAVLLLRYEEMRRDPRQAVLQIAEHVGVRVHGPRVDEIVALSSIESMRGHQDKFDHATERLLGSGKGEFIRQGQVGQGRAALSAEQERRFQQLARRARPLAHLEADLRPFLH